MTQRGKSIPQTQSLKVIVPEIVFSFTHNTEKYCHTLGNTVLTVRQTNPYQLSFPIFPPAINSTVHPESHHFHSVRDSFSINYEFGYSKDLIHSHCNIPRV